jgi:hypothetical protein
LQGWEQSQPFFFETSERCGMKAIKEVVTELAIWIMLGMVLWTVFDVAESEVRYTMEMKGEYQ